MNDGQPGFDDVVFNDCSITLSKALGSSYDIKSVVYFAISAIIFAANWKCLKITNDNRKDSARNYYAIIPKRTRTVADKVLLWGMFHSANCLVFAVDMDGYAGRLPWAVHEFCLMVMTGPAPSAIIVELVNSWITIVDGGKSKKTPQWAKYVARFELSLYMIVTILDIVLGFTSPLARRYSTGYDVTFGSTFTSYFKGQFQMIYTGLLIVYGRKISASLKTADKKDAPESSAVKKIKKYIRVMTFISIPTLAVRVWAWTDSGCIYTDELCKTYNQVTPCISEPFWWFFIIFWAIGAGVPFVFWPDRKSARQMVGAVVSTVFSKFSSTGGGERRRSSLSGGFGVSGLGGTSSTEMSSTSEAGDIGMKSSVESSVPKNSAVVSPAP
jgi:hypothetical protein